jgi:tetratricopeptide (TPR) repeat protein
MTVAQKRAAGSGELRAFLSRQEKEHLVDLLCSHALVDDRLLRTLTLEQAKSKGGQSELAAVRRNLEAAFDTEDIYSYHEVSHYADRIDRAVSTLEDLLKRGRAEEVIDLAEQAIRLAEQALGEVDDSDGEVYGVLERLGEIHLKACRKAKPAPEALARRLFALELRSDWESFYGAVDTYASVLGKKGLAVYRELAEAEWKKIPALKAGDTRSFDGSRCRVSDILQRLARTTGDLEALIAVKSNDLSEPYFYLDIAQVCREAGEKDLAIEWAEKGIRAFPKRTDPRLRSFLAGEYGARRNYGRALDLLWANFADMPGVEAYKDLKKMAERAKAWPEWREEALALLQERAKKEARKPSSQWSSFDFGRGASRLVEILLWEKKVEPAWAAARDYGCSEELWLRMARLRELSHPEDSLAVYQRQAESAVQQTNQRGYEVAIARLTQVRDVMTRLGKTRELAEYLAAVRLVNNRKRNFVKLLDAAKLG